MFARTAGLGCVVLVLGSCSKPPLPHEGKSVQALSRMLDDPQPRAQAQGALGLSLHGSEASSAVPRLTELLDSDDTLVRQQAALALGKIGPDAREAVSALERLLQDRDWTVRRQAALALGGIGQPSARRPLEKLRGDSNKLVQKAAEDALSKLPAETKR